MTKVYRSGYNMFAVNGILHNHESYRRGDAFVTKKITHGVAEIIAGREQYISLGNLEAKRDWGFAPEYVEAMVMMLQRDTPDDYVIGTGETHSVNEFMDEVFTYVGLDVEEHVKFDSKYSRPTDVDILTADASKAKRILGWKPKIKFRELVKIMADADLRASGETPPGVGDDILRKRFPDKWWVD
jgi:GDPmannose 4,6-dehydratase